LIISGNVEKNISAKSSKKVSTLIRKMALELDFETGR